VFNKLGIRSRLGIRSGSQLVLAMPELGGKARNFPQANKSTLPGESAKAKSSA
jgi:hypothetical protein